MLRKLDDGFFVAPQITTEELALAKAAGVRTVINNRPDGEEAGQPPGDEIAAAAQALGMGYVAVPVVSGGIFPDHAAAMQDAVQAFEGPYLAYCRSGTRSTFLWAMVAAKTQEPHEVAKKAAEAGYDVSPAMPLLQRIHAAR